MHCLSLKGFTRNSYDKYWRYRLCKERKKFQVVFFSVIQVQRLSILKYWGYTVWSRKDWEGGYKVKAYACRCERFNFEISKLQHCDAKSTNLTCKSNCVKCRAFVVHCYSYWLNSLYVMLSSLVYSIRE